MFRRYAIVSSADHRAAVEMLERARAEQACGSAPFSASFSEMVAGLIAQHPQHALEATALAVYLHGLAGDLASESVGENSLVATDLVRFLPQAFAQTRNQKSEEIRLHP